MAAELVRVCPTCGDHNPPERLRCRCGALLFGVDLTRPLTLEADEAPASPLAPVAAKAVPQDCQHADCGQPNPPDATSCVYCNRPLTPPAPPAAQAAAGLLQLPAALRQRYRVIETFHARGMEAEILLVAPLTTTDDAAAARVVKVYRQGILPSTEVQQRIARVDVRHCVQLFESGISDGHAYELMEYCAPGSLRQRMPAGEALPPSFIVQVARELAEALQAVHAVALVHRDLKPENVLMRCADPLDLVLTDFGSASVVNATQRFTSVARTLLYAAPEALSGVIDAKADYWALGMLLLEMAVGAHPFQGLSEAVVLHHLTTRAIDVGAVGDAQLRKLLRGLLLRDPKLRWGGAELARWLAGDASLPEPVEHGVAAGFAQPYAVLHERCHTPEQLAVAFARHWQAGLADMANGQLLRWFTEVQKDQNAVRLLLELRYESHLNPDQQLLRLILHFAPGIPPVWQGRSIELHALLVQANQALQGDEAAADGLRRLHEQRVLDTYAATGNAQLAELAQRWNAAADDFEAAWVARLALLDARGGQAPMPGEVVRFDDAVFGRHVAPRRPSPAWLHPRLLALAYDPAWVERLRGKLTHALAALVAQCPWLTGLGDPSDMSAAGLLVCDALLPEARQAAEQQVQHDALQRQQQAQTMAVLRGELQVCLAQIGLHARKLSRVFPSVDALRRSLDEHAGLMARVRALSSSDDEWLALRRQALRREPAILRLRELCDRLSERMTANAGWFSESAWEAALAALVLSLFVLGARALVLVLLAVVGIAAWRVLPIFLMVQDIRRAGKILQGGAARP